MSGNIGELSCSGEQPNERRTGDRTATVFRPVLIETDEFAGFCLVRNLSPSGLMGVVYTQFAEGLPVSIQFNQDLVVPSMIIWSQEGRVGIRFDEAIDVSTVLVDLAKKSVEGKLNRSPRVQIQCDGELSIKDRSLSISVLDISQRGIKVRASFVRPGDEVLVRLEGLEPRKAFVRWIQNGTVGMNFARPIGFEELAEWVIRQQTGRAPVDSHLIQTQDSAPINPMPSRSSADGRES